MANHHPRDVAQLGSALRSGRRGRWFESSHPDLNICTHKSSDLASTGFDLPQPPLKKGEPDSKSPFFKGDLGGSLSTLVPRPRCVYTVAPWGEGLKPSAYMKRVRENSGFQVRRGLNQVHVENCSFSPHPQPLAQRARGAGKAFKVPLLGATAYTQVF